MIVKDRPNRPTLISDTDALPRECQHHDYIIIIGKWLLELNSRLYLMISVF